MVFCVISILCVWIAPDFYSYGFCISILVFYCVQNFLFFSLRRERGIVCFEFFFMLSFFATNFIYPVFYFPTKPDYSFFGYYSFNYNVISKSTAIAYLAYTFYLFGISSVKNKISTIHKKINFNGRFVSRIHLFFLFFFILYAVFGGITAMRDVYSGDGNIKEVAVYSYFRILYISCSFLLAMFIFKGKNKIPIKFPLISLLFICLLLFSTGTRGSVVGVFLILMVSYDSYIKRIPNLLVFLAVIIGLIALTFIMQIRGSNMLETNLADVAMNMRIESFFDLFTDLIVNNRNLYVLVDFADTTTYTYFLGMLSDFLALIPGLLGFVSKNIGIPTELITSGELPTYLTLGPDSKLGLGTNVVGEAYVAFGYLGVVIFFYLIGYIVSKTKQMANSNIYAYVIYFLFVAYAVSYPRLPVIFNARMIIWSLLIMWFVYKLQQVTIRVNLKTRKE